MERIPTAIAGVRPLKGKRNPVRLVSSVAARNSNVARGMRSELINPPSTVNPARMPTMLIAT